MLPPEPLFFASVVLFGISTTLVTFVAVRVFYLALPFLSLLRGSANRFKPTTIGTGLGLQVGARAIEIGPPLSYPLTAEADQVCPP
jgi:hypothetical protein